MDFSGLFTFFGLFFIVASGVYLFLRYDPGTESKWKWYLLGVLLFGVCWWIEVRGQYLFCIGAITFYIVTPYIRRLLMPRI